jgi:FkbM family methyltransferase
VNSSNIENFKAQNGEDHILVQDFANKKSGFCVEVGAYDGVDMSNTYLFEKLGWKCLLVEADPEMAKTCQLNRPLATVVNCAVVAPGSPSSVCFQVSEDVKGMSSLVLDDSSRRRITGYTGRLAIREITTPARTLDAVLEEFKCEEIDFVSVDVEGHELGVLKGFDIRRWKPRVVLVERTGVFPVWKILRFFDTGGYSFSRRTGDNDWYYRTQQEPHGAVKLFIRFYLLPLPRLLPTIIARGAKGILFKLGIYKKIVRFFRKKGVLCF